MQDKKNVDAYKASIKAQLSRAGLIRGQPRHNPLAASQRGGTHHLRQSANNTSNNVNRLSFESFQHTPDPSYTQNNHNNTINSSHLLITGMHSKHLLFLHATGLDSPYSITLGSANSSYDDLSRFEPFDPSTSFFPQTALFNPSLMQDSLVEFSFLQPSPNDMLFPDPTLLPPTQSPQGDFAAQESLVVHYFDNVHKMQSCFGGKELNDITYAVSSFLIISENIGNEFAYFSLNPLGHRRRAPWGSYPRSLRSGRFTPPTNESSTRLGALPKPREISDKLSEK